MPIDMDKCQELIDAAASGDLESAGELLKRTDVDVNYRPPGNGFHRYTGTALYHAIENFHEKMVELILRHPGVDIDLKDIPRSALGEDLNALCHAVMKGYKPIVFRLLDKAVDVSNASNTGMLHVKATAPGHAAMPDGERLVRLQADMEDAGPGDVGNMLINHYVRHYFPVEVLEILLEKDAEVIDVEAQGQRPLHQYPDIKRLLGGEPGHDGAVLPGACRAEDSSLVQDDLNDFSSGMVRARSRTADGESGECKKRFPVIRDDGDEWVQLPCAPRTEPVHVDAALVAMESSTAEQLGADVQECAFNSRAMDYHHL